MSDHVLNNLNKIENDIHNFGIKVTTLLERIREYMNGNILDINENDFKIEEIVSELHAIHDGINSQVDEIYNENNFRYKNKLLSDTHEQISSLNELGKLFGKLK
jgi:hypothetical protein